MADKISEEKRAGKQTEQQQIHDEQSARKQADVAAADARQNDEPFETANVDETLAAADDAVTDMEARERRRDQGYRSGGDDQDSEINDTIDQNAPKESQIANKPTNGSRNRSDWN